MTTLHNLGFPRIGERRELKFALEAYWRGEQTQQQLLDTARELRQHHWEHQRRAGLDWIPVGDFSLYDQVLDTSFLLGHLPRRFHEGAADNGLDQYFRVARGRAPTGEPTSAGEMTKWFDTNYHYIVPEFEHDTEFRLNPDQWINQIHEARDMGLAPKPVVLGPVSYLYLGKCHEEDLDQLAFLNALIPLYQELIRRFGDLGVGWVQIDEPILAVDLPSRWRAALQDSYEALNIEAGPRVLLTSYFGPLGEHRDLVESLPVDGVHIDAVRGREDAQRIAADWPQDRVLSLGVVDGRNVWRTALTPLLDWLGPIHERLGDKLWLAPSCSLLHVPVSLDRETDLDPKLRQWLAFATEKLDELRILGRALNEGRDALTDQLVENARALAARAGSDWTHRSDVSQRLESTCERDFQRQSAYTERARKQREYYDLPMFPTTTIGSFPQTTEIRHTRRRYRAGELDEADYRESMKAQIAEAIREQEDYGLDVLVHGEAERNDMVEYFGEQLDGYAFTRFGWVQSFGSRCVKPPIIYGDVARPRPMTVEWSRYAQSLTDKPVKGMLTGPITMLQWAFVRDDQPRSQTAFQIALALRDEVIDLEQAGITIIQVDEPALREGLPLRQSLWPEYLGWAVRAFRLATTGVADSTQIHTHMCYSEFNDIMEAIAELDADVITIETSRSNMELLDAFTDFEYPNEIGPGVYDIHSPNEPGVQQIVTLMKKAAERIPERRLWVNPDCGLKTRNWEEVRPALRNMVLAAQKLRGTQT